MSKQIKVVITTFLSISNCQIQIKTVRLYYKTSISHRIDKFLNNFKYKIEKQLINKKRLKQRKSAKHRN